LWIVDCGVRGVGCGQLHYRGCGSRQLLAARSKTA